jgi:hypothetical protein
MSEQTTKSLSEAYEAARTNAATAVKAREEATKQINALQEQIQRLTAQEIY